MANIPHQRGSSDPTAGTSWGPNGSNTKAFRDQLSSYDRNRTSWDGGGSNNNGGGGGGSGCMLMTGLIGLAGLAAAFFGAKYGVGA